MANPAKAHARFSPSGASKWIRCHGSLALESVLPNKSNKYSIEGTAAHTLAEKTFRDDNYYARAYLGEVLEIKEFDNGKEVTYPVEVTEEMVDFVQEYVDEIWRRVYEYKLLGDVKSVQLLIEQKIDFSNVIGIPEQFGTADIVIVVEYKDGTALLSVEDLKYGMGVIVHADDNEQLMTYAAGALDEYSLVYNVTKINVAIHQIRKEHISEAMYTVGEIRAFGERLKKAAQIARKELELFEGGASADKLELTPGDKQCRFCKAAAHCPALANKAFNDVLAEMDDPIDVKNLKEGELQEKATELINRLDQGLVTLDELSKIMKAADLLDDLIRVVRGRVEAELFDGKDVPDFKIVEGRKGRRAWFSTLKAEGIMKAMRLKQEEMYDKKIISPARAEKLLAKESPRRWNALKKEITQHQGKPSVAPISDKRPALVINPTAGEFEDFTDNGDDLV